MKLSPIIVSLLLLQLAAAAGDVCQTFPGVPGRDGRDGKDGTPGVPGPAGPPGTSEISYTAYQELRETLRDDILNDTTMGVSMATNVLVSELEAEVEDLKGNVSYLSSVVEDLRQNLTELAMALADNPCAQVLRTASSCKEIYDCNPNSPSGFYSRNGLPSDLMYCGMNLTRCGNITGGWTRVAHIDMRSTDETCPSPLETIASPRSCSHSGNAGCSSVKYSTFGINYTRVCGRAIGYQYASGEAFSAYAGLVGIDSAYVDGLSITYDTPRRHLWTYAVGWTDTGEADHPGAGFNCPVVKSEGHSHLRLCRTITTVNQAIQVVYIKPAGSPMTHSGMVMGVLPVTPAVTLQTCHGLTEQSTQHQLLTSNCACVRMNILEMKMWD